MPFNVYSYKQVNTSSNLLLRIFYMTLFFIIILSFSIFPSDYSPLERRFLDWQREKIKNRFEQDYYGGLTQIIGLEDILSKYPHFYQVGNKAFRENIDSLYREYRVSKARSLQIISEPFFKKFSYSHQKSYIEFLLYDYLSPISPEMGVELVKNIKNLEQSKRLKDFLKKEVFHLFQQEKRCKYFYLKFFEL